MQRAVSSQRIPLEQGLGKAGIPLLFIYGEKDQLVNPEASLARALSVNREIRSALYPDSGHAPFLEEPERFNRDLAAFAYVL
ncbi:alpha/beta fold hydrolase [Brenneria tiliae]|uniref:Alpha/beta hydrolase n=1 Tax=Brenneria tiliae TaxID=2914984 RepID=A0ABT0MQA9_9GAMM|nr:alpha/beta hydrolase [Brenneria tiliae]MCL2892025.1 alpha/beta hydrolase [Brenneria tiliae]